MKQPRRILLLITGYSRPDEPRCWVRELVHALAARGHSVFVVVISWQEPGPKTPLAYTESELISVLRLPRFEPRLFGRRVGLLLKWPLSSLRWQSAVRRWLGATRIDLLFAFSPLVTVGSLARWCMRRDQPVGYFYTVDFFPFHQHSLGLVPGGPVFRTALAMETRLIRMFDVIGCMSPANVAYLRSHYALRRGQHVHVLPLGIAVQPAPEPDRDAVRSAHGLPLDRPLVLFGGQITEGRGIEEILAAARLAAESGSPLFFVLIGRGRLEHLVEAYVAEGRGNLVLLGHRPRDEYLSLAASCDIGLVVTVRDVNVPTFPSKTLDYLQAGLPVVASVEASTDFGAFIEQHGFGLALEAGRPEALCRSLEEIASDPPRRKRMAGAGRRVLETVFNVEHMADAILQQADAAQLAPDSSSELRP